MSAISSAETWGLPLDVMGLGLGAKYLTEFLPLCAPVFRRKEARGT